MKQVIKRSLKFSLKEANIAKKSFFDKLWKDYRQILEHFVDLGWNSKKLPAYADVKSLPFNSKMSKRYIGCAMVQVQAILKSCFKKLKKRKQVSKPEIKSISLKYGKGSFVIWFFVGKQRS
jgi:hypothetical protein